jgi:Na+-translocating membrane potential-generating system (MpsC)
MGTFAHDRAPGRDRRQDLRLDRGIFAECYGRGPTKAKTYMVDDYVFTVLENILTTVERTLVNNGREDLVRQCA